MTHLQNGRLDTHKVQLKLNNSSIYESVACNGGVYSKPLYSYVTVKEKNKSCYSPITVRPLNNYGFLSFCIGREIRI